MTKMQTTDYKIPERIIVNGKIFRFEDIKNIKGVNQYLDMIEKLQIYDDNIIFGRRFG